MAPTDDQQHPTDDDQAKSNKKAKADDPLTKQRKELATHRKRVAKMERQEKAALAKWPELKAAREDADEQQKRAEAKNNASLQQARTALAQSRGRIEFLEQAIRNAEA